MKSGATSKKFPANRAEWEAVIARAPGKDRKPTVREEAAWSKAVVVRGGGYSAVNAAVAARRRPGQRGAQVAPTKKLVSVRYSPEVLEFFKSGGVGWQTRMDDVLKRWVASHSKSRKRVVRSDA
ncbi:MAG: BrnA antitoxin family protein [Burkholderiales bacterium]|nr:BrnA antitoxin family protein [Burkholderiales bacterium]